MSEAKSLKLREYGTDILSHSAENTGAARTRHNNTFKSSAFDQAPPNAKAVSRERFHPDRPLTAQIQRTSFQDSNIFGYKD